MSSTTAVAEAVPRTRRRRTQPAPAEPVGAVGQLHRPQRVRGHLPGAAVLHADDQPEVVGGDLGAERQPVAGPPSDAGELLVPDHLPELPDLLPEFGDDHDLYRGDQHGDLHPRRVQPGADGLLGQQRAQHRRVPDLPDPGLAAVPAAVPDHRHARADQQRLVPGDPVSDPGGAVLHLDHDRLFQLDPEGAGRGGADRRRRLSADAAGGSSSRWRCPASSPRRSSRSP